MQLGIQKRAMLLKSLRANAESPRSKSLEELFFLRKLPMRTQPRHSFFFFFFFKLDLINRSLATSSIRRIFKLLLVRLDGLSSINLEIFISFIHLKSDVSFPKNN